MLILYGLDAHVRGGEAHARVLLAGAAQGDTLDTDSFNILVNKYGSPQAGRIATLLLALDAEEKDGAIEQLEKIVPDLEDPALKLAAVQDALAILVDDKKYDESVTFLESAADNVPEDAILYFKGWLEEARGNDKEAKKLHDQLSESFEKSSFTALARARSQYL